MVSMSAEVSSVSVGWIGAGRLARALAVRASHAGMRCAGVASRTPAHAASLAEALAAPPLDAQGVADRADWVFVTVPDDAIAEVAAAVRWRPGQLVIHCSGAGERDLLDPARRAGAATASFHPSSCSRACRTMRSGWPAPPSPSRPTHRTTRPSPTWRGGSAALR